MPAGGQHHQHRRSGDHLIARRDRDPFAGSDAAVPHATAVALPASSTANETTSPASSTCRRTCSRETIGILELHRATRGPADGDGRGAPEAAPRRSRARSRASGGRCRRQLDRPSPSLTVVSVITVSPRRISRTITLGRARIKLAARTSRAKATAGYGHLSFLPASHFVTAARTQQQVQLPVATEVSRT